MSLRKSLGMFLQFVVHLSTFVPKLGADKSFFYWPLSHVLHSLLQFYAVTSEWDDKMLRAYGRRKEDLTYIREKSLSA